MNQGEIGIRQIFNQCLFKINSQHFSYILQKPKHKIRMYPQKQLCKVPKIITLEYHQGQQLNTTLVIDNLVDKVVDFKIKSNKPELYLVKPMEGSIYKKESTKINFKRKQLAIGDFEGYLRNPASIQQKFQIQFKCMETDLLGVERPVSQVEVIFVKFSTQSKQTVQKPQSSTDEKRIQDQNLIRELELTLESKKNELQRVTDEDIRMAQKVNLPQGETSISKLDLINLIIIFLLVGLAL